MNRHDPISTAEERLADVLEKYVSGSQAAALESKEQLLRAHPELASDLENCLGALEFLQASCPGATPEPPVAGADPSAVVLGDYRLVREVGRGGMGIVFEAQQCSLGRRVALKVLPWATLLDRAQRERFQHEARLAAQLHHTNIVPVYSVGSERGVDYYAMQFIDGEPLQQWVKRQLARRPALVRTIASLGAQAADALAHAHQMKVVHRDIKPNNLLVDKTGNLWITDFGVAQSPSRPNLTETGARVGTLRYMSPEQYAGKITDHRTDIYALGATLRDMLESEIPDTSSIGDCNPRPEPRIGAGRGRRLPRDLCTILTKCTAESPNERYHDAGELAEDLRHFVRGEPILAKRPGLWVVAAKWTMRHRRMATAASVALACVLAGLLASTAIVIDQRAEADRHRLRAETESHRVELLLAHSQVDSGVRRLSDGDQRGLLDLVTARRTASYHPTLAREIESLWCCWRSTFTDRLLMVVGHERPVSELAWSPNNDVFATAADTGEIRIWDAATGRLRAEPWQHEAAVTSLEFSGAGDVLASGDAAGEIFLWEVATGRHIHVGRHPVGGIRALAFGMKSTLASIGQGSNSVCVWNPDAPIKRSSLDHRSPVSLMKVTTDARRLVTGAGNVVSVWDLASGRLLLESDPHEHSIVALTLNQEGAQIATACADGTIRRLVLISGEEIPPRFEQPKLPLALCFSPDGQRLACASSDRSVRVWDLNDETKPAATLVHPKRITTLVFSPDSQTLASGCWDGAVRLWEVDSGVQRAAPLWHQAAVHALAFDANGERLATASADGTARVWRSAALAEGVLLQGSAPIRSLAVSPDSQSIVTGTPTGTLTCWDVGSGEQRWRVNAHSELVTSIAYSSDGALLATGSEDQTLRVWNAADGQPHGQPVRFSEGVKGISFFPGGRRMIVGCNDKSLTEYDVDTLSRQPLVKDDEAIKAVAINPTGTLVAFGTNGWRTGVLHVDGRSSDLVHSLEHEERIRSLCFSPVAPHLLAVGGEDGVVRIWDLLGSKLEPKRLDQVGEVLSMAFSPDGSWLATAARNRRSVRIWDVHSSIPGEGVPLGRQSEVLSVAFSPDGKLLVSGWEDGTCWLWPVPSKRVDLAEMERATLLATAADAEPDGTQAAISWRRWQAVQSAGSASH